MTQASFRALGRTVETFHLQPGEGVPPHKHDYSHVIYVAEGEVLVHGIGRVFGPDTQVVFQAGDEHGFEAKTPAIVVSMFVTKEAPHDPEWLDEYS